MISHLLWINIVLFGMCVWRFTGISLKTSSMPMFGARVLSLVPKK